VGGKKIHCPKAMEMKTDMNLPTVLTDAILLQVTKDNLEDNKDFRKVKLLF
jgi:hypothetical protein